MAEAKQTLVEDGEVARAGIGGVSKQPGPAKTQTLHPLIELTSMRVREFLREKEAVFWVFIFPVLMTFALGIAFRNTGPDKTPVAVEAGATDTRSSEIVGVLSRSPEIT